MKLDPELETVLKVSLSLYRKRGKVLARPGDSRVCPLDSTEDTKVHRKLSDRLIEID